MGNQYQTTCGSGLARDEAPRRHQRLIAGKPAPTQRMRSARHWRLVDDQVFLMPTAHRNPRVLGCAPPLAGRTLAVQRGLPMFGAACRRRARPCGVTADAPTPDLHQHRALQHAGAVRAGVRAQPVCPHRLRPRPAVVRAVGRAGGAGHSRPEPDAPCHPAQLPDPGLAALRAGVHPPRDPPVFHRERHRGAAVLARAALGGVPARQGRAGQPALRHATRRGCRRL